MKIPQRVHEIIVNLYNSNILLARGPDHDVRELTKVMAEQIRFELGPGWGYKRNLITYMDEAGKVLEYYWQDRNTKSPISPSSEMTQSPVQSFTAVLGIDHLRLERDFKEEIGEKDAKPE